MKRFFAIFGICFGALVVFLGGYLGVKYLIGDFNEEVINPENISFEQEEYFYDEGSEYFLTINTTTEGVTKNEKKITLSLIGGQYKTDKDTNEVYCTDGVIIIPKVAEIGTPFQVKLVESSVYKDEIGTETPWTVGGISNIIATSVNKLIAPATTKIYVDTPVYKTELVVLNNKASQVNFNDVFKNVEHSTYATVVTEDNIPNIRAGETFYVGVKYYPSASAIKYSKMSSTNLLVEYKNQILAKIEELELQNDNLYADLLAVCSGADSVSFAQIMETYKQLVKVQDQNSNEENPLVNFVSGLIEGFNSNLKYNNILEKTTAQNKAEFKQKVAGTNLYEYVATQNLGTADFITYTFKNTNVEISKIGNLAQGADILSILEEESTKNTVLKKESSVQIVDEEVDTVVLSGSIQSNINTNRGHVIYATKQGTNSATESFLNLRLSNSSLPNVNLQNKVVNIGLMFQKKLGTNWVDASDDIKFKNELHYSDAYKIEVTNGLNTEIYYRPFGEDAYWEIYAETYVEGEFRAVIKYFVANEDDPATEDVDESTTFIEVANPINEEDYPKFSLIETTPQTEGLVSWLSTDEVNLKVINIQNALNVDGSTLNVNTNQEYDLSKNINKETLANNVYTTVRYFIYSDNTDSNLSDYFDTKTTEGIEYSFNDGSVKKLYELNSEILKLKSDVGVPTFTVKAIFATIKTNVYGQPIMDLDNPNKYNIIKYSAYKENLLERLSAIEFSFTQSLQTISGTLNIEDTYYAGVVKDKDGKDVLKVANNIKNILKVNVTSDDANFKQAVENEEIKVVAKLGIASPENFVTTTMGVVGEIDNKTVVFTVSTKDVLDESGDVIVKFYIVYSIGATDYYFPVVYNYTPEGATPASLNEVTIVANINGSGEFNFNTDKEKEIEKIKISTIYDTTQNKVAQTYEVFYKGETTGVTVARDDIFDEEGKLKVYTQNFLKIEDKSVAWYLTSSNGDVISVSSDRQILTMLASGTSTINLHIDGVSELQDSITIEYVNDGYVAYYKYLDGSNSQNVLIDFRESSKKYQNKTESIKIEGTNGRTIEFQDAETEWNVGTSLFAMWYYLEDNDGNNDNNYRKLSFKVTLADESSINNYQAITGSTYSADGLSNSAKLGFSIGKDVVLNLVYTCIEIPTIVMKINLTITPVLKVTNFEITDNSGNTVDNSSEYTYTLKAGHNYSLNATISPSGTAVYYIAYENELEKIVGSAKNLPIHYDSDAGKFYFDDVDQTQEYRLFVSDQEPSALGIGKLQQEYVIFVEPNITTNSIVKNNAYVVNIPLNDDGTYELSIESLFVREKADSRPLNFAQFNFSTASTHQYDDTTGIIKFKYDTTTKTITNSIQSSITFKYSNKTIQTIKFVITPQTFISANATRIAKYNGENAIVLVAGTNPDTISTYTPAGSTISKVLPDIITGDAGKTQQFIIDGVSGNEIYDYIKICKKTGDRYSEDKLSDCIADGKIAVAADYLFTDTQRYILVSDKAGNITTYKIIISQIEYPFVNIKSTNVNFNNYELDIYKLFVGLGKEDLSKYYKDNSLYVGDTDAKYYGGDSLNLIKDASDTEDSIYLIDKVSAMQIISSIVEFDADINEYVTVNIENSNELATNLVGGTISLHIVLKVGKYSIPTIIVLNQSQNLIVNYPGDDTDITYDITDTQKEYAKQTLASGYGTQEYDQIKLTETITPFGNAIMEYVNYDINGLAQLVLTNERFIVQNLVDISGDKKYKNNNEYNDGFEFEISALYAYASGVFTKVNPENISYYLTLQQNILNFNMHGLTALRAKILVRTSSGGAENYYYVQAGGIDGIALTLYKNDGLKEKQLNAGDIIEVVNGNTISFTGENVTGFTYSYYLKNHNKNLNYRVISDNQDLVTNDVANKKLTINLSPNSSTFKIEIYTIYGTLCIVDVNVKAYYTANIKKTNIYSGTQVNIADLLEIKTIDNTVESTFEVIGNSLGTSNTQLTFENYEVDGQNIKFAHSKTSYTINNFTVWVKIGENYFLVEIPNLLVSAGISSKSGTTDLGEIIQDNSGYIKISKDKIQSLFTLEGIDEEYYDIKYYYIFGGTEEEIGSAITDLEIDVQGKITQITQLDLEFKLVATNIDNKTITYVSSANVKVKPFYTVVVNYSQGATSSFDKEFAQINTTVSLDGKTLNNNNRINVFETDSGNPYTSYTLEIQNSPTDTNGLTKATIDGKIFKAGNLEYEYIINIKVDGIIFGRYVIQVQSTNPFAVIDSINEQTLYAGYGTDKPFEYGKDLIVTLPTIENAETRTIKSYQVVIGTYDEDNIFVPTALTNKLTYYPTINKVRVAVDLENCSILNSGNVYVTYTYVNNSEPTKEEETTISLGNIQATTRYTISYMGYEVDYAYYENIISDGTVPAKDSTYVVQNQQKYTYSVSYNSDLVGGAEDKEEKIEGYYLVECDIQMQLEETDGVNHIMNANEFIDGLSFVSLFNITDKLGNTFNLNHITDLSATITLDTTEQKAVNTEDKLGVNPIRVQQVVSNGIVYDYKVVALGATNNGTIVTLKFTYMVGDSEYIQEILIKVISDVRYVVLNNDTTSTPNSQSERLELDYGESVILADASQNSSVGDAFYVYAYGNYDTTGINVAQTLKISQNDYKDYGTFEKTTGNDVVFGYKKEAKFGNKDITLTFVDNFGYTFYYYITLKAGLDIPSGAIKLTKETYYENETLNVYNKNASNASTQKGISVDVKNDDGTESSAVLYIADVNNDGYVKEDDIEVTYNSNNPQTINYTVSDATIKFGYQTQAFWQSTDNGLSVTLTLRIPITNSTASTEYYIIEKNIVLVKRYDLRINPQNTYVRDGEEFDLEHLASVYDYSLQTYLGEPVLKDEEVIRIPTTSLSVNTDYTVTAEGANAYTVSYEYETDKSDKNATLTLNGINVYSLMLARAKGDYSDTNLGTFTLKYTKETDSEPTQITSFSNDIADLILSALCITYNGDGTFSQRIRVIAVNNKTGYIYEQVIYPTITYKFITGSGKTAEDVDKIEQIENNVVVLSRIFDGVEISSKDYDFVVCAYNDINDGNGYVIGSTLPGITTDYTQVDYENYIKGLNSAISFSSGFLTYNYKTRFVESTIKTLDIAVDAESYVLLDIGNNQLDKFVVPAGKQIIDLVDEKYTSAQLYSGLYKENVNVYTKVTEKAEGAKVAYNGMTVDAIKLAKNISSITFVDASGNLEESKTNLTIGDLFEVDTTISSAIYQSIVKNVKVVFSTHSSIIYIEPETIRTTLKYTGIDDSNAYVGNVDTHFIKISNTSTNIELKDNVYYPNSSGLTLSLKDWGGNFALIPGVGRVAEIAKFVEAGTLDFVSQKNMLSFKLKEVLDKDGKITNASELVEIDNNANIILKDKFNLSNYYISVEVFCKYPQTGTTKEEKSIGTIYLAFDIVKPMYTKVENTSVAQSVSVSEGKTIEAYEFGLTSYLPKIKLSDESSTTGTEYNIINVIDHINLELATSVSGITLEEDGNIKIASGTDLSSVSSINFDVYCLLDEGGDKLTIKQKIGTVSVNLNKTETAIS